MKLNKSMVLVSFCASMWAVVPEHIVLQNSIEGDVYIGRQGGALHWNALGRDEVVGVGSALPVYVLYNVPGASELKKGYNETIEKVLQKYDTTGELKAAADVQDAVYNAFKASEKFPHQNVVQNLTNKLKELTGSYNAKQTQLSEDRDMDAKSRGFDIAQREYEVKSLKAQLSFNVDIIDMYVRELSPSTNATDAEKRDLMQLENVLVKAIQAQIISVVVKYKSPGIQKDKFYQEKNKATDAYTKELQSICEQAKKSSGALLISFTQKDDGLLVTGASQITITGDASLYTTGKSATGSTLLSLTGRGGIYVHILPNLALEIIVKK